MVFFDADFAIRGEIKLETARLIEELLNFQDRLQGEVRSAYAQRGDNYGYERFDSWKRRIEKFLEQNMPGEWQRLNARISPSVVSMHRGESDLNHFWRVYGGPGDSFLESIISDLREGDYEILSSSKDAIASEEIAPKIGMSDKVFIVHGHNDALESKVARFIEKIGCEPIILHEQANLGKTIIEKIESYTDVGFAVILYTSDDKGNSFKEAESGNLNWRARQNVVFEHGYLMAKLGRSRCVPLVGGDIELPSDISGVVYVNESEWQFSMAKEMKAAGYKIDFNKIV